MKEKSKGGKIPNKVWLLISFLTAKRGLLEGYPEQPDFRKRRICSWLYLIAANCYFNGMVPAGKEHY